MWELIFLLLILKIPMVYVGWVVWWAIKAEPIVGSEGEPVHEMNWKPWRKDPNNPRPRRGGPHGRRAGARKSRRPERTEV